MATVSELYNAVMRQKIDKVREILDEDSDLVNKKNREHMDQTPIFAAVYFTSRFGGPRLDEDILDLLFSHAASLNHRDKYGRTVLHLAATELRDSGSTTISENKVNSVISKLIKEDANVMQQDNQGDIPLFSAIIQYNEFVVKALLKNSNQEQQRYQLMTRNEQGYRPLKVAKQMRDPIITDILKMYHEELRIEPEEDSDDELEEDSENELEEGEIHESSQSQSQPQPQPQQPPSQPESEPIDESSSINNKTKAVKIHKEFKKMEVNARLPINITKTEIFNDPIMLSEENIKIEEFIAESPDNVVLMYFIDSEKADKTVKYFFTQRNYIDKMAKDDASVFYGCYKADTALVPRDTNVFHDSSYLSLKSIGLIGPKNYCIIDVIQNNPKHQLFAIKNTDYTYPTFTSQNVLDGGNVVSALHCQAGHQSGIAVAVAAYPSTKDDNNVDFLSVWGSDKKATGGKTSKSHKKTKRTTRRSKKHSKTHSKKKTRKNIK